MKSLVRLIPFAWPYRRRIAAAIACSVVVAMAWSVSLALAFPVIKILLEGQGIGEYVAAELADANADIEHRSQLIRQIGDELNKLDEAEALSQDRQFSLLREQIRQQRKVDTLFSRVWVLGHVQDHVVPRLPRDKFELLASVLCVLLLATLIKGIFVFLQDSLMGTASELTILGLRKQLFRKILSLDYQSIATEGTSTLMSRFTYDLYMMSHGLSLLGGKLIREPLKALACMIAAFVVCWQLTLLSLLFVPPAALMFSRFGSRMRKATQRLMESMSRIYKSLEETLSNSKVVIAFDSGGRHRRSFHHSSRDFYKKSMKIVKIDAMFDPAMESLGMVAVLCALLPGAYLVLRETTHIWGIRLSTGQLDIAELSVLYALLAGIFDPLRKFSKLYTTIKQAGAASERVFEVLDREPLIREPDVPLRLTEIRRGISLERVTFQYDRSSEGDDSLRSRPPALDGVDLFIPAGETVVVVGENGSGKSTLVHLLPRLFEPVSGKVCIDGIDIKEIKLRDLRRLIGFVTQDTVLFDDTIFENIRYGTPHATDEQVRSAATAAFVDAFVNELPDGFQTKAGPKGQALSGGQRQRIALARAILRDPQVLILDEATSAIDQQSERLIHSALRDFARHRTVFLITHAVNHEILDFVDRIVVMKEGRLVDQGPHAKLLSACPEYSHLFASQQRQKSA